MLLIEQVRELGKTEAQAEEKSIAAARHALTQQIARGTRAEPKRSHRGRWIGLGGLVAGAGVTAIVVGSVFAPVQTPSASAAEVLNKAAEVTIHAMDTELEPGQYLRIEDKTSFVQHWNSAWANDGDPKTEPINGGADSDTALWIQDTRALYVPADRADEWFYDWGSQKVVKAVGAGADEAEADWFSAPGSNPTAGMGIEVLPGGQGASRDGEVVDGKGYRDAFRPQYGEMPRDPQALLSWFQTTSGVDADEFDDWFVAAFEDPTSINLMPPDLRAAMYRALALVPGITISEDAGETVTLHYARDAGGTLAFDVNVDQGYIESTYTVYYEDGVAGELPSDSGRRSVTMTVVDSAP